MNCLFIDSSSDSLTLAIVSNDKILAENNFESIGEHSKYAMVGISEAFAESNLEPNDIDKVLVVNGPGSWTGIRIGVTIAKVYGWSLKKVVIPISSLRAYALSYEGYDYYVSVIDARREHVYAGIYDKDYKEILEERYMSIASLKSEISKLKGRISIIGNIDFYEDIKTIPVKLKVHNIVNAYKDLCGVPPNKLNPKYLKKTEAEEKREAV